MTLHSRRAQACAAMLAGGAIAVPSTLLVVSGADAGRAAFDAAIYHERVIRAFIEQFPSIDVRNPLTTTTPGFHAALAAFGVAVSDAPMALRLVATAIGTALVALVAAWCARFRDAAQGALLALPLACSIYVIGSAAWVLPDDASWLLVALTLALCLREPWSLRTCAGAAALLVGVTLVRQMHIWTALPVAVACMLPQASHRVPPARRMAVAAAVLFPACAVLAAFVALWGGPVPPRFQADVTGANWATPSFILFQFAIAGIAFLPWLAPAIADAWAHRRGPLLWVAAVALAASAVPATVPDFAAGRYSGLWVPLAWLPSIAGHSNIGVLLLAPAGAVLVASALFSLAPRQRAILCSAVVGFIAAATATHYSWQRYHEPFVLLLLAMLSALQPTQANSRPRARLLMFVSIGALCGALWAITWRGLQGETINRSRQPYPEHLLPGETFPAMPAVRSPTASHDGTPPA